MACEFCPDGHEAPERRPWAVYVDTVNLDHDGQPTRLIVGKTGCQHVAESDAEWLREVIRQAKLTTGEADDEPCLCDTPFTCLAVHDA